MDAAFPALTRIVQSSTNRWVRALRTAVRNPPPLAPERFPDGKESFLVLEGVHLVSEAVASGLVPAAIFLRIGEEDTALQSLESALQRPARGLDQGATALRLARAGELISLPGELFNSVLGTESPQPIAALVPVPAPEVESILKTPLPLVLVLASLQDPGNLGTLLRSAEAFGASGALVLPGTVTPWNPKSLRASAGSALRLPMVAVASAAEAATLLREHGIRSYAAVPSGGKSVDALALHEPAALWIGNEGAGLSGEELALSDGRVTLRMPGEVESLNAAVAGSLLFYEASRQRAARAPA